MNERTAEGHEALLEAMHAPIKAALVGDVKRLTLYPVAVNLIERLRQESLPHHLVREIDAFLATDKEIL